MPSNQKYLNFDFGCGQVRRSTWGIFRRLFHQRPWYLRQWKHKKKKNGKKSNKNKKKSHATLGREKKALFLGSLGGGSLFQGIIAGQMCATPWGNFSSLWVPSDWADRQATWKPQCIVGKESSLLASLNITTQWHLECLIGISPFLLEEYFQIFWICQQRTLNYGKNFKFFNII